MVKLGFEFPAELENTPQREKRNESETAIDQLPVKRNPTNGATDQRQRKDTKTGDNAHVNITDVTHGIPVWRNEEEGDHQVAKGQPIRAIGNEMIFLIGNLKPLADKENPLCQA